LRSFESKAGLAICQFFEMEWNAMRLQDDLNSVLNTTDHTSQQWLFRPLRAQSSVRGFVFDGQESTLGSGADCRLRLDVAGVATSHCRLVDDDGRLLVIAEDNRTWINDGPVRKGHLRDGDRLTVGPITLQVEAVAAEVPQKQPANDDLPLRDSRLIQYLERAYDHGRVAGSIPPEMNPAKPAKVEQTANTDAVVDELHRSLKATQDQLLRQQEQIARLEEKPRAADVSELKREIQAAEAEKQRAALQVERDRLQAERDSLSAQFEKWLRVKRKWTDRFTGQRSELNTELSRLTAWQNELQDKQDELQDKADQLLEREQQLTVGQKSREEAETRIDELSRQASSLEAQLESALSAERETEARLRDLEEQLREFAAGESLTADLQSRCDTLSAQTEQLEEQLKAAVQEREQLQGQLAEREQTVDAQAARLTELEQSETSLRTELDECLLELSSRTAQLDERTNQLEELHGLLSESEADKERLSERCQMLEQEGLEECAQRQVELDAEWERLSAERDRVLELREQLAEHRAAFTQAHEDLRSVREELEEEKGRFLEQQEEWTGESLRQQILDDREESQASLSDSNELALDQFVEDSVEREVLDAETPATGDSELAEEDELLPGHSDEEAVAEQISEQAIGDPELADAEEIAGGADWNEHSFEDHSTPVAEQAPAFSEYDGSDSVESDSEEELNNETDEPEGEFQFSELRQILGSTEEAAETPTEQPAFESELLSKSAFVDDALPSFETENVEETAFADDASEGESDDEFTSLRKELADMFGISSKSQAVEPQDAAESDDNDSDDNVYGQQNHEEEEQVSAESLSGFNFADLMRPADDMQDTADVADESTEESFASSDEEPAADAVEAAAVTNSSEDVVVDDIEDADSVAAYMQRLFARTEGSQDYSEPAVTAKPSNNATGKNRSDASGMSLTAPLDVPVVDGKEMPVAEELKPPKTQIDREQLKLEIASLRDVANQTARHALATHAWKQVKLKMMASGALTAVSAVASVALISSPMWSPVSYYNYGLITLVLTGVSAFELFRSRLGLIRMKQQPVRESAAQEPVQPPE